MNANAKEKNFFYALLGIVALICVVIFWPFLTVIIIGASLAVTLYPLYKWTHARLKHRWSWLAALSTVLVFLILLGLPIFFVTTQVLLEAQSLYFSLSAGGADHYIGALSDAIHSFLPTAANFDLKSRIGDIVSFLSGTIATVLTSTLSTIFSLALIVLTFFYLLKDGEYWRKHLMEISPLSDQHNEKILNMLTRSISGVMKGYVFIALMQGLLLGVGLRIFGVPNAALWGVLAGIASMIPSVGTAFVSVPAVAYLFLNGEKLPALGLVIWAMLLVGMIDNFLTPLIVGKSIEVPPVMVLFSVLGGIALTGIAGVIIGPLAVSLLYTLIAIYKEDFRSS